MSNINQIDIRSLRLQTQAEIPAITNIRDGQLSYAIDRHILYAFHSDESDYIVDGVRVLASDVSVDARWIAVNSELPIGIVFNFDVSDWVLASNPLYYTLTIPHVFKNQNLTGSIYSSSLGVVQQVFIDEITLLDNNTAVLQVTADPDNRFMGVATLISVPSIGLTQ